MLFGKVTLTSPYGDIEEEIVRVKEALLVPQVGYVAR